MTGLLPGGVHDLAAVEDEAAGKAQRSPAGNETAAQGKVFGEVTETVAVDDGIGHGDVACAGQEIVPRECRKIERRVGKRRKRAVTRHFDILRAERRAQGEQPFARKAGIAEHHLAASGGKTPGCHRHALDRHRLAAEKDVRGVDLPALQIETHAEAECPRGRGVENALREERVGQSRERAFPRETAGEQCHLAAQRKGERVIVDGVFECHARERCLPLGGHEVLCRHRITLSSASRATGQGRRQRPA